MTSFIYEILMGLGRIQNPLRNELLRRRADPTTSIDPYSHKISRHLSIPSTGSKESERAAMGFSAQHRGLSARDTAAGSRGYRRNEVLLKQLSHWGQRHKYKDRRSRRPLVFPSLVDSSMLLR